MVLWKFEQQLYSKCPKAFFKKKQNFVIINKHIKNEKHQDTT